jgi:hypothetical protein
MKIAKNIYFPEIILSSDKRNKYYILLEPISEKEWNHVIVTENTKKSPKGKVYEVGKADVQYYRKNFYVNGTKCDYVTIKKTTLW